MQGIGFVSTNEGWLGGGSLAAPNNFIHTTDGGATWSAMGYVNANNLNRFRFASPTLGYLSGIKLHVFHIPPAATVLPAATNAPLGSNVTFTATAYGTAPMQFQWRLNGNNLSGGTTNGFTVTNNFAIVDNVSVGPIIYLPVQIVSPRLVGNNFIFNFATDAYESYSVQWTTNLATGIWTTATNFYASGATNTLTIPLPAGFSAQYFRVSRP